MRRDIWGFEKSGQCWPWVSLESNVCHVVSSVEVFFEGSPTCPVGLECSGRNGLQYGICGCGMKMSSRHRS